MVVKIRLNKNRNWDREIAEWVNSIPHGYRAIKIKEILYHAIQGKVYVTETVENKKPPRGQGVDSDISKKISKLIK